MNLIRKWWQRYFTDPQAVFLVLLLVAGFTVVLTMGDMLTPVIASLVIAYLLEGLVAFLERFRAPRLVAVALRQSRILSSVS